MSIQVKFFASLREKVGMSETKVNNAATANDAWNLATSNSKYPDNMLIAINLEYANFDDVITDGDEVAFFPPVTGG